MNEDKLSNSLGVVFDPLSEQYIICDKKSALTLQENSPSSSQQKRFNLFGKLFSPKLAQEQPAFSPPPQNAPNSPTPSAPQRPPIRPTPPPPPRPTPPPPPPANQAVGLSRSIYNDLDALVNAYRDLQNFEEADIQTFQNLENQTLILRATMGNIYRTLSGNALPPLVGRRLVLSENYCASLKIVADFIADITDKTVVLMGLVNVSSIDRQLFILNATLSSQERTITRLYNECRIREV